MGMFSFGQKTEISVFFSAFSYLMKVRKFATFIERPKAKRSPASGGFAPLTPCCHLTNKGVPVYINRCNCLSSASIDILALFEYYQAAWNGTSK